VVSVVTGIAAWIARVFDQLFIQSIPRYLAAFARRPIGTFVDTFRRAQGEKPGTPVSEPDLVTIVPAGVSVLFAIGFLFVLAFAFTMLFK